MENEKKNSGMLVGILVGFVIALLIGVGLFATGTISFKETSTNNNGQSSENSKSIKVDESKDYVYDAEYEANTQYQEYGKTENGETYKTADGFNTVSYKEGKLYLKDLVVPYININNQVASTANNEIKKLYEEYVGIFDKNAKAFNNSEAVWGSQILTYYTYKFNNVLSIVVTYGNQQTDILYPYYLVYNFDLTNGELLNYEQFLTKFSYTSEEATSLVEKQIDSIVSQQPAEHNYTEINGVKRSNADITKETFQKNISENKVLYFIDDQGNINYIINVATAAGRGDYPQKVTITK